MDADKAQITELLVSYATGIDSKDWPLFRSCWTDEVDLDYGEVGHFTDPDVFTDLFAQEHNPMGSTYHRVSNFVISVDGDTATARTYVHAVLMVTPDDDAPWVDVIGHYDDVAAAPGSIPADVYAAAAVDGNGGREGRGADASQVFSVQTRPNVIAAGSRRRPPRRRRP